MSDDVMPFPGTLLERINNAPLAKNPVFDTRLAGRFQTGSKSDGDHRREESSPAIEERCRVFDFMSF